MYDLKAWRYGARLQALYDANYRCARCDVLLVGKPRQATVHHRKYLKRAPALALEPQNLLVLCRSCHSTIHVIEARNERPMRCDALGNPISPDHRWNGGEGEKIQEFSGRALRAPQKPG
jgi:hypothetical protein